MELFPTAIGPLTSAKLPLETKKENYFDTFPKDIILMIFAHLSLKERDQAALFHKRFQVISGDKSLQHIALKYLLDCEPETIGERWIKDSSTCLALEIFNHCIIYNYAGRNLYFHDISKMKTSKIDEEINYYFFIFMRKNALMTGSWFGLGLSNFTNTNKFIKNQGRIHLLTNPNCSKPLFTRDASNKFVAFTASQTDEIKIHYEDDHLVTIPDPRETACYCLDVLCAGNKIVTWYFVRNSQKNFGYINVYDAIKGQILFTQPYDSEIVCCKANEKIIVIGLRDGSVLVLNVESLKEKFRLNVQWPKELGRDLCYFHTIKLNQDYIFAVNNKYILEVYDAETGQFMRRFQDKVCRSFQELYASFEFSNHYMAMIVEDLPSQKLFIQFWDLKNWTLLGTKEVKLRPLKMRFQVDTEKQKFILVCAFSDETIFFYSSEIYAKQRQEKERQALEEKKKLVMTSSSQIKPDIFNEIGKVGKACDIQ